MDYLYKLFSGSTPAPTAAPATQTSYARYQPLDTTDPIVIAETAIASLSTNVQTRIQSGNESVDQIAAFTVATLLNMWRIVCDHSRDKYSPGTYYGNQHLTKQALDILNLLDSAIQDSQNPYKAVISSLKQQLYQMQDTLTGRGSRGESYICLTDGTLLARIIPLTMPAPLPAQPLPAQAAQQQLPQQPLPAQATPPLLVPHHQPLPAAALDIEIAIRGARRNQKAPTTQEIMGILSNSHQIIRNVPQTKEQQKLLVDLYVLVSQLSDADKRTLLQDHNIGGLVRDLFYNAFDAMMQESICLNRPEFIPFFCTYFAEVFSLPDFSFHPNKEMMSRWLEHFLVQNATKVPPSLTKMVQTLFVEVFSRSFEKVHAEELRPLFIAYEQFASKNKPIMELHERLTILHLANKFPSVSGSMEERLSRPFKEKPPTLYDKEIRCLYAPSASLGDLVPREEIQNKDMWETIAINTIHQNLLGLTSQLAQSDPINVDGTVIIPHLLLLQARVDLLRRLGYREDADQLSVLTISIAKNIHLSNEISVFLDTWDNQLTTLQQRHLNAPIDADLEPFEREAERLLIGAGNFFRLSIMGLTKTNTARYQTLLQINDSFIHNLQKMRFEIASQRANETIEGDFSQYSIPAKRKDEYCVPLLEGTTEGKQQTQNGEQEVTSTREMPGRSACVMIAGYTAASMLKGEMTDKDALHKAMLMGISRYQDVVQASQNDQDPLTTYLTQFSDGDEIRVEEGDHLSSFYLHALDGIISSDTSISVLQKGSFSIPPQGGDKAWKAKLEWLRTRKPDDKEKIAAVVIKGASAFSIMINQDDSVQITDSHPSRFGKKAAFSKTFRSLEAAAIFLNALYPYTPPRNGRIEITTKNQVEFTPLVLPDHQTQKNEDIRYAEDPTLLGLLTYCAPPQESPQPAAPTFPPLRLPQGIQQKHIQIIQEIQQAAIIDEMNIAAKKLGALAENQDSVALQLQENFRGIAPSGSSKDQMILIIKKRATQLLGAIQRNIQPTLSTAPLPASFSAVKTDDELIADFYSGSPIPTGRGMGDGTTTLRNILSFSDTQLEHEHRYIQWLFPTPYPSEAQRGSPHYNTPNESILKNAQNTQFRGNMQAALQRMIQFYGGIPSRDSSGHLLIAPSTSRFTDHIVNGDHNLLRITRIIQSLRLHGLYNDAQAFYNFVTPRAKRNGVSEETLNYWREALKLEVPQKH